MGFLKSLLKVHCPLTSSAPFPPVLSESGGPMMKNQLVTRGEEEHNGCIKTPLLDTSAHTLALIEEFAMFSVIHSCAVGSVPCAMKIRLASPGRCITRP